MPEIVRSGPVYNSLNIKIITMITNTLKTQKVYVTYIYIYFMCLIFRLCFRISNIFDYCKQIIKAISLIYNH